MDNSKNGVIEVKVLDAPGLKGGCGCGGAPTPRDGITATIQEKCDELRAALEDRFPGRTRVQYRNLFEHPEEKETQAGQALVNRMFPPPIIVIAGQPKFAGSIQVNRVIGAVESHLKS
jgi:hypothetical protein